jgi:adenylate cyclase class 2
VLEVEMKFPVQALRARLDELGVRAGQVRLEEDQYFAAPDRDFARTDEALRLRRVGDENILTYKGPKLDATTKTRREIEVALHPGSMTVEHMAALLAALGYRPVATIRKERATYTLSRGGTEVEVCLDDVAGVGSFVELETVVPDTQVEAARAAVHELARELALGPTERRSYLELWLGKHPPPDGRTPDGK